MQNQENQIKANELVQKYKQISRADKQDLTKHRETEGLFILRIIRKQETPENNQWTNQQRNYNQTTRLEHDIVN